MEKEYRRKRRKEKDTRCCFDAPGRHRAARLGKPLPPPGFEPAGNYGQNTSRGSLLAVHYAPEIASRWYEDGTLIEHSTL